MEFSKKIYIINIILVILVFIASIIIIIFSDYLGITDLNPLSIICTSSFGLLGIANIFYFRKAQAENVIKISKQIKNEEIDIATIETANQVMNSDFNNSL